jgi:hypothetical protein
MWNEYNKLNISQSKLKGPKNKLQEEKKINYGSVLDNLSTHEPTTWHFDPTTHSPNKPSAVTIYFCDIPTQSGQIIRPPKNVTFLPKLL